MNFSQSIYTVNAGRQYALHSRSPTMVGSAVAAMQMMLAMVTLTIKVLGWIA